MGWRICIAGSRRESPETEQWVAAHNALTDSVVTKFAAALQAAQLGSAPILLRIDTDSGHGGGNAVQENAQNAEILAFAAKYLDLH